MSRVQQAIDGVRAYLDVHAAVYPGLDGIISTIKFVTPQPGKPSTEVITLSAQDLVALTEFADLMLQSRRAPERSPDPEKVHRGVWESTKGAHPLCAPWKTEGLVLADRPEDVDCPACLEEM